MYKIRNFKAQDFEMVQSWWKAHEEFPPTIEMLPEESTFICEHDGIPLSAITVYLTNSKEFCMLDNFVGNPEMPGLVRQYSSILIIDHAERFAKDLGYKSMMCLAFEDKLKQYYQSFGYKQRLNNVSTFNKELV